MYNPSSFRIDDLEVIRKFVADHPFAQLISHDGQQPLVSHLPLIWKECSGSQGELVGHFAKANQQWKEIDGTRVLVVFTGPHAYISSSWYETPNSVPTWNYTAVHVYGTIQLVADQTQLTADLKEMVTKMESGNASPWSMDQAGSDFIQNLMQMIVGFKIIIEDIECKFKLSQNHSDERQQLVVQALEQQPSENSNSIAKLMNANVQ